MRWSFVLLFAVLVVSGCKSGASNLVDPFVGRTKVEPPRTGWINGQPSADPYYSSQPRTARQQTPTPAGSSGQSSGGSSVPANRAPAFEANRSSVRIPPPVINVPSKERLPDYSAAAVSQAGWTQPAPSAAARGEGVIRVIEPRAKAENAAPGRGSTTAFSGITLPEPRLTDSGLNTNAKPLARSAASRAVRTTAAGNKQSVPPGESIDIINLPKTRSSASRPSEKSASGVRLASATTAVSQSVSDFLPSAESDHRQATSLASRVHYGYDPQYRWLKGKLQYSQIDKRWKLRYIPIDGATDDFGGSVVLSDKTLLSGCERGDFVEVQGRLGPRPKDDQGYSPVYEVTAVKRSGG